jgi:hypothetical protein
MKNTQKTGKTEQKLVKPSKKKHKKKRQWWLKKEFFNLKNFILFN